MRVIATIVSLFIALLPMVRHGDAADIDTVTDKTLVVWVQADNLEQRGGSALTIEDKHDHFDGVVFGELDPGKWMAGSDFYLRSQRSPSSVPREEAAGTALQIAIVYRGASITLYRSGVAVASYQTAAGPPAFGPSSFIVFGKRHRHAGGNAHFAGRIRDARIYSAALSAAQIIALTPCIESGPKPWAWWSFADGSSDRMGRFPVTTLSGGAHIADGWLVLDGKEAEVICSSDKMPPYFPETPALPNPIPSTWLTFHLAHPGPGVGIPGDPNCAFDWKGEVHLHYIYNHEDGFAFAHVSSKDMVHWHWHPTTLTPTVVGHGMFSGTGFLTKEGQPAIIYHGQGSGRNQIQLSEDDKLETWSRPWPVEPIIHAGQDASLIANWDPDAWLEGETYYALSGGSPGSGKPPTLFKSTDLHHWDYLGLFLEHDMPDVLKDEDISCPNFFKIGGKRMLLCISHTRGCRYYIGEWKNEKFVPEQHHRMNWHGWDFFAPESVLTHDGRRVMWARCHLEEGLPIQSAVQSLPRELSLPKDGVLRIEPLRELSKLRYDEKTSTDIKLKAGVPTPITGAEGDALEMLVRFNGKIEHRVCTMLYTDEAGNGGFPVEVNSAAHTLTVGSTSAPFELKPHEALVLRVFIDKNVVEVFANGRQAVVAACRYTADHEHMSLISRAGDATAAIVKCWKMHSIYTKQEVGGRG